MRDVQGGDKTMSTNRVMVRFDTTLQVTLPHCDECDEKESESGENVEPCERCREAAVSAAVSEIGRAHV